MFTDLFIKFLNWIDKHGDLVMKVLIFAVSVEAVIMFVAAILAIPEFIKELIGR